MATQVEKKSTKRLEEANRSLNDAVREGELKKKDMVNKMKAQDKIPVTISPMYKPYFGEVMEVIINGVYVSVPCDGRQHMIPECFASEVNARIFAADESQRRANRMADITKNNEDVQGDINFF